MQANIKKQLSEKNMTAAELERRTGIPHAVINILHGRSKNPSIRTAQAIAKELGCSVEDLISDGAAQTKNTTPAIEEWNSDVYMQAVRAICVCIQEQKLQPTVQDVTACVTEVYEYTIGGQSKTVEHRFAQWVVNKSLGNL